MPRIIKSVEFLIFTARLLLGLSALFALDWLLGHHVFGSFPFFEKLSLHTSLLTAICCLTVLTQKDRLKTAVPIAGLAYCGLLLATGLQAWVDMGTASPGTLFAFACLLIGTVLNRSFKLLAGKSLIFFIFTSVQAVGVVGVAQFLLGISDLGDRGLFEALSPATSLILLILAPILFVQSSFNLLSPGTRVNQARQDLALALFSLPIGVALLCLIPRTLPTLLEQSADLLLTLLALSSMLGCWYLYYFGTYAGEKEEEATLKLEQQALQLEAFYESRLQVQREIAEEQKRFSSVLAHEIRTPLATVLGSIELMRIQKSEAIKAMQCEEAIEQIESSAKLLREMINSVLDYAKLKAGQLTLSKVSVNLPELAAEVMRVYKPMLDKKGIAVSQTTSEDLPCEVLLDAVRVREVLSNLIDNAHKFTPKGGRVDCRLSVQLLDGQEYLRMSVIDSGVGIEPSQLDRIFQPFKQASEGVSRRYGGTGLGLSYSRELVDFMGGRLEVESTPGKGSEFRILLPLERTATEVGQPGVSKANLALLNIKALMVEDHELNADIQSMLLGSIGVTCDWAENGEQALQKFDQPHKYDVVFMDINLGEGISGLQTAEKLRERFGKKMVPIIAMTAGTMQEDLDMITRSGMGEVIGKPFDLRSAHQSISRALQKSGQHALR